MAVIWRRNPNVGADKNQWGDIQNERNDQFESVLDGALETVEVRAGNLIAIHVDDTETDLGPLPVAPGGDDAGVASYIATPGSDTQTALKAQIGQLKAWAKNPDQLVAGALAYTSGLLTSAVVEWPDGKPGVLTITSRQASTGAVTAYNVTHVDGSTTRTYTQPTITRDSSGAATLVPQITVA